MKRATEQLLAQLAPHRFGPHPWDAQLLKYLNEHRHVTPTEWAHIRSNLMEFIALSRTQGWSDPLPDDLLTQLMDIWDAVYLQPRTMLAKVLHTRDWLERGVEDGFFTCNPLKYRRKHFLKVLAAKPLPEVDFESALTYLDPMTPPARYIAFRSLGMTDEEIGELRWRALLEMPKEFQQRHWHKLNLRQVRLMGARLDIDRVFAHATGRPYPLSHFRTLWRRAVLLAQYAQMPEKRALIELYYPWRNKRIERFATHDVSHLKAPALDPATRSPERVERYTLKEEEQTA